MQSAILVLGDKMFYNQSIEDVLKNAQSSQKGLSGFDANNRKDAKNLNKLQEEKKSSLLKKFILQFSDVMVIILLISAVISITLDLVQKNYSNLYEGGIILIIVFLNATMGVLQENKAESALENLKKRVQPTARVLRDGKIAIINTEDLVVGDIVMLETGNIVPADLRLIETNNLLIDEASLTGESVAVIKDAKAKISGEKVLAEQINMAFAGTIVNVGKGTGVVVRIGKNTEMGKIADMLITGKKELTPLQKSLNKIGKIISIAVLVISVAIFFMELIALSQVGVLEAFMSAVALAVAAIPESLPAVITIIMALGVQRLADHNAIIKRLHAVETLGNCQIICSDKTGTITQNKMTVKKVFYDNKLFDKNFENSTAFDKLVSCMTLCNDCYEENNVIFGEPTEKAIFEFSKLNHRLFKDIVSNNKRIDEIPFTSERKKMTVVDKNTKQEVCCYAKGGLDEILNMCKCVFINGKIMPLTKEYKAKLQKINETMSDDALRVLAFAFKGERDYIESKTLEENFVFVGMAGMIDPPRAEVFDAVKKCHEAGLKPVMITGDQKNTAFAIANELGIANSKKQVLLGKDIEKLSDEKLKSEIMKYSVFARVNPEHKVRIVKAFKSLGKIVAMTGDGVNDAPSLKIADIGIGMGIMGTEVTKDVADMIITDDNFATIVTAVEEGRKIYANIQKTIQFLLSTNAVEVVTLFLACMFFPSFVFLLPSQILFINFITDSLPAIGLGLENAESDIMTKPPHENNNIIDKRICFNIVYQAFAQIVIVMIVFVIGLKYFDNITATTMCFFVINYMQLLHSINLKDSHSLFRINIFRNKVFNITFVIGVTLVTLVAIFRPLQIALGLTRLNLASWIIVAIASFSIIPIVEICKKLISLLTFERIK